MDAEFESEDISSAMSGLVEVSGSLLAYTHI
jgi:hypothetical protein